MLNNMLCLELEQHRAISIVIFLFTKLETTSSIIYLILIKFYADGVLICWRRRFSVIYWSTVPSLSSLKTRSVFLDTVLYFIERETLLKSFSVSKNVSLAQRLWSVMWPPLQQFRSKFGSHIPFCLKINVTIIFASPIKISSHLLFSFILATNSSPFAVFLSFLFFSRFLIVEFANIFNYSSSIWCLNYGTKIYQSVIKRENVFHYYWKRKVECSSLLLLCKSLICYFLIRFLLLSFSSPFISSLDIFSVFPSSLSPLSFLPRVQFLLSYPPLLIYCPHTASHFTFLNFPSTPFTFFLLFSFYSS